MNKKIKNSQMTMAIIAIIIIAFSMWKVGTSIQYSVGYEDYIIETIRDNVKDECLINE